MVYYIVVLIVTKDGSIYDLGGGMLPWHMCTLITNQFINAVPLSLLSGDC